MDVGDADPGEDGGPPVGAVGGVTRRLHAPLDNAVCRVIIAIRRGRGPAGRRSRGRPIPRPATPRDPDQAGLCRYGPAHPGAVPGHPCRGLGADLGGEVPDVVGAGGQVRRPVGLVGEPARDGGQPRQRPGLLGVVPGRVQPVVQHRGQVAGGAQFPVGRRPRRAR